MEGRRSEASLSECRLRSRSERSPGADHYFNDRFEELQAAVREYFTRGPGAAPFPDSAFT